MKKRFLFLLLLIFSFFNLCVVSAKETEVVTKEELSKCEIIEPVTITYINPLYSDVITADDLFVGGEPNLYDATKTSEYHTTNDSAAEELRNAMKNRLDTVTISIKTTDGYRDAMNIILSKALEHTGMPTEGDYIRWQYGGYRASISTKVSNDYYYYDITYSLTYYTTKEEENALDKEISKLMNELNLTGNDYENITKIYKYMINNITYDYDHLSSSDYKLQYTAYAALINKTSVCQGYAVLLYRLALENGIDARLISGYGNGGGHGWNIIKLGKYYYNADATWDASYAKYNKMPYYLRSNANFSDHTRNSEYDTVEFNNKYKMSEYDYSEQPDKEENKNGIQYNETTKKWEYYVNGKVDTTYNGIATNENGTWIVDNGIITFKHNEVILYNNKWYAFINSRLNTNYTGLGKNQHGTWYVQKGIVDFKYNGTYKDTTGNIYIIKNSKVDTTINELRYIGNIWYYFKNGKTDLNYIGLGKNQHGIWYVKNGKVDFKYNGTYKDSTGNIYIIKNSKVDTTINELRYIENNWYYFKNGKTELSYNGIATNENGTWIVDNGIITFKHNEVILYNNKWYAFINSKLNTSYNGLGTNQNGTWYVQKGIVDFKYNGPYKDTTGNIYIIKNSKVDTTINEVRYIENNWYYFKNGKTELTYTGLGKNQNGTWYVKNGKVDFKYNGTYKDSTGKIYTIKNSKVINI